MRFLSNTLACFNFKRAQVEGGQTLAVVVLDEQGELLAGFYESFGANVVIKGYGVGHHKIFLEKRLDGEA